MELIQKMNIYEVETHTENEDSYKDWRQTWEVAKSMNKLWEMGIYIKNRKIHKR